MTHARTFAGLPGRSSAAGLRVAILGVANASPYVVGQSSHAADAPAAIRKASEQFRLQLKQFDFDTGATLSQAQLDQVADLGDVPTDPAAPEANRTAITAAVKAVLDAGAMPIVLGGDDSVPIPAFAAYEGHGPLHILQVDAHADWGDAVRGNPFGFGSPMRRASEHPWITGITQVGMRGLGSGTQDQLDTARAWGATLVTAREVRRNGVAAALQHIPPGARVILSIDCDGLDPSVLPAVNMPTPGGLDMTELTALLQATAAKARIAGCNLVELVPARDPDGLSALIAARIALTVLGLTLAA